MGINGSTLVDQFWPAPHSSGYPYVLENVIAQKPDVFVMQHGTNDNALGHSLGRYLWTYRHTIRTLKEKVPGIKIVCMTVSPSWNSGHSSDGWLNQANAGIQEIAAMENTLLAQTYYKLGYDRGLLPDRIHPNDAGHKIMAESVFEALQENDVKHMDDFDLTFRTPGEYKMCGYSIRTKGNHKPSKDNWVRICNFGQKEFEYTSYCDLEIVTPLKYCGNALTVNVDTGGSVVKVNGQVEPWCGRGTFTLPATNGKMVKVKIEL